MPTQFYKTRAVPLALYASVNDLMTRDLTRVTPTTTQQLEEEIQKKLVSIEIRKRKFKKNIQTTLQFLMKEHHRRNLEGDHLQCQKLRIFCLNLKNRFLDI